MPDQDLVPFLEATEFVESEAQPIRELAESLTSTDPKATSVALFNWVRDQIRYDPARAADPKENYRATAILESGEGYCVQKAVLLAALGRAAGIPTRLGFADVRNHKTPEWMHKLMGTNLFVFHGYVEFFLDGGWVKATPAFDRASAFKAGALLVELDGSNDAMLHPVDPAGHPYIEYVRDRGWYADVPVDEIQKTFREVYAKAARDSSG